MNKKLIFISNLAWQNKNQKKIIKIIKDNKFTGIDFAPLQITNNWSNIKKKVRKYSIYLKKNKIKVNAVQGIFFKKKFNVFQQEPNFTKVINHLNIIIKLCHILKCNKIIIGSTEFRSYSARIWHVCKIFDVWLFNNICTFNAFSIFKLYY